MPITSATLYRAVCDRCGIQSHPAPDAQTAADWARGWRWDVSADGRECLCPRCKTREQCEGPTPPKEGP